MAGLPRGADGRNRGSIGEGNPGLCHASVAVQKSASLLLRVSFDSEVRKQDHRKMMRASESGH